MRGIYRAYKLIKIWILGQTRNNNIMQFAIIAQGGKQYKVKQGGTAVLDKIPGEQGSAVIFDKVLLIADEEGKDVKLGAPYLEGVKVEGKIIAQVRGKKVIGVKYKPKVHYRRKYGFRAELTKVQIGGIGTSN
jgi:large subunit ribosomal protein L21